MLNKEAQQSALSTEDFLNIIKIHVPLEKNGALLTGYCPLCYDEEESFLVYPSKQRWHCYACQQEGDITHFIEKTEHLSSNNAIKFIEVFIKEQPHMPFSMPHKEPPIPAEPSIQDTNIDNNIANDPTLKHLLTKFHNCHGCQGIALIDGSNDKLIGSSINDFGQADIQALHLLFSHTLTNSMKILGDFSQDNQDTLFRMEFSFQGHRKKMIWIPELSSYHYTILLLLDEDFLEKILLMKLKQYFNNLQAPAAS